MIRGINIDNLIKAQSQKFGLRILIRNLKVFTYNEALAHQVAEIFESFSVPVKKLLRNFEKLK